MKCNTLNIWVLVFLSSGYLSILAAPSLPTTCGLAPTQLKKRAQVIGAAVEFLRQGNFQDAKECAEEGASRIPQKKMEFLLVLAKAEAELGNIESSENHMKEAQALSKSSHSQVQAWDYIGPFVIGKSEFDGDPLAAYGGILHISPRDSNILYPSELVDGGFASWSRILVQKSEGDIVTVSPQNVRWNNLVQGLNSMEALEYQGWAIGNFFLYTPGRYMVTCKGVASFFVDDLYTPMAGDIYYGQELQPSLLLEAGAHTLYLHIRAKVTARFGCTVTPVQSSTPILHTPHFLPDLVDGYLFSGFLSIPINNVGPDTLIITVTTINKLISAEVVTEKDGSLPSVIPGQISLIRVALKLTGNHLLPCPFKFKLKIFVSSNFQHYAGTGNNTPFTLELELRCRTAQQSFIFTFLDHDGTISQAAAIAPLKSHTIQEQATKENNKSPVILTMHGTSIKPQDQADSYKQKHGNAKDYSFGVEGYWLLAPTRHGAHNWEHTMRLTAFSALEALADLVRASLEAENFVWTEADKSRVVFAGHSMGGHGAWHSATLAPDIGLGVVSSSGWIKKEYYGDSNAFMIHDVSTSYIDPSLQGILLASVAENEVDQHVSNLNGMTVLTRVGQDDMTVHPWFARRMHRLMIASGVNATYSELRGKEHWWWDTESPNDGGVNNDEEIRHFFAELLLAKPQLPSFFRITLYNPATFEGKGGIQPLQLLVPFQKSTIDVTIESPSKWHLKTRNIETLKIDKWRAQQVDQIEYIIDSESIEVSNWPVHLCFEQGISWNICNNDSKEHERFPSTYGPIAQISSAPMIIVIGTSGSEQMKAQMLQSGLYLANMHYHTTDSFVQIKTDEEMIASQTPFLKGKNIVFLGGPFQNSYLAEILGDSMKESEECYADPGPISFFRSLHNTTEFQIGPCSFALPGVGLISLIPIKSTKKLGLVVMGTDAKGLSLAMKLAVPTIPPMARAPLTNLLPDYIVLGQHSDVSGFGGIEMAGYWSNEWRWKRETSYYVC